MRVELLVVTDCPNERPTYERLRRALDDTGRRDTPIAVRTVTEDSVGSFPAFAGSPTVVIDGADPFAEQASPGAGLSCRVYRCADGTSGAPSLDELSRAVARRGDRDRGPGAVSTGEAATGSGSERPRPVRRERDR